MVLLFKSGIWHTTWAARLLVVCHHAAGGWHTGQLQPTIAMTSRPTVYACILVRHHQLSRRSGGCDSCSLGFGWGGELGALLVGWRAQGAVALRIRGALHAIERLERATAFAAPTSTSGHDPVLFMVHSLNIKCTCRCTSAASVR